jgi:ribosome modulation factor
MKTDYTAAIDKMNRETKEDKLEWREVSLDRKYIAGDEHNYGKAYTASVNGKTARIYPYQTKEYTEDGIWYWSDHMKLEFIDYKGQSEWEFPPNNAIYTLYESIQYKVANVEGFLKDYTSSEPKEDDDFP